MANALYICYFGIREPLVQTQVLPYLRELRKDGHKITLLTFEPDLRTGWTAAQTGEMKQAMKADGIVWEFLAYHRRPSAIATAYDIFRGAAKVRTLIRKRQIDILHGRVHVPTLMGALGRKLSRRKPKLLFDIRGFFPEEYTEAGIWPENGAIYRAAKRVEKWLMNEADGFVVLTHKAREVLFGEPGTEHRPVEVIPCCVDLEKRFAVDRDALRSNVRSKLGLGDRFVVVHAGALGGLYLNEQIADFLAAARELEPSTFAIFLTQTDPRLIVPLLRSRGYTNADFFVGTVAPDEVPAYLCAADVGLSFVRAGYATQSRSPTKIPEYLACGLPLIANSGVGDVDDLINERGVGIIVKSFDKAELARSFEALRALGDVRELCRETARLDFDLVSVGGERYRSIYSKLVNK